MDNYIILSSKKWNSNLHESLKKKVPTANWILIDNSSDFSFETLQELKPVKVFIPHWSSIIPKEIFSNFDCIVFHMTDLPYGRGGSPLQNLIVRGHKDTKISAIKVVRELDAGPVYLKKDLDLSGTAEDIFYRANGIILQMIMEIIENDPTPVQQIGEPTIFKRRKPKDGNMESLEDLEKIFDYIRMLDAEGYPKAFIETEKIKFEFTGASLESNEILANVRITKK